jgi:hypothetical protein
VEMKVEIADGNGNACQPSAPVTFETGLLHTTDWTAEWIGTSHSAVLPLLLYAALTQCCGHLTRNLQGRRWHGTRATSARCTPTTPRRPSAKPSRRRARLSSPLVFTRPVLATTACISTGSAWGTERWSRCGLPSQRGSSTRHMTSRTCSPSRAAVLLKAALAPRMYWRRSSVKAGGTPCRSSSVSPSRFAFVCPEPVLANARFSSETGSNTAKQLTHT